MTSKEALEQIMKIYGETGSLEGTYDLFLKIKQDLERLEVLEYSLKLKQDAIDSLNVANELLSNRVNVLMQENEKLKKENQQLLVNKNVAQALAIKYKKEVENLKKHNARLTRKIQNLYKEHATLIGDLSLLRSNNEALLKLIGGIEVINNE